MWQPAAPRLESLKVCLKMKFKVFFSWTSFSPQILPQMSFACITIFLNKLSWRSDLILLRLDEIKYYAKLALSWTLTIQGLKNLLKAKLSGKISLSWKFREYHEFSIMKLLKFFIVSHLVFAQDRDANSLARDLDVDEAHRVRIFVHSQPWY